MRAGGWGLRGAALATRVVLVSVIPAAGCTGGAADADESPLTVRDSAGVTIVESRAPRWGEGEGWTVDPEPLLDLTETGEELGYEFERVADGLFLSGGRVAVAEWGRAEVGVYDAGGIHLATLGGEGEGPGEYDRITALVSLPGDSLGVIDFWLRRLGVYGPEGTFGRVATFPELGLLYLHPLPGGGFVAQQTAWAEEPEPGLVREPTPVVRLDPGFGVEERIATAAGYAHVILTRDGEFWGDGPPLFRRESHLAVRDGRVYLGDADSLGYDVRDPSGDLLLRVRVPGYDLSAPPELVEAERELWRSGGPPGSEMVAQIPDPGSLPAYSDLVVDAGGNVWLQAYLAGSQRTEPTRWRVFAPDGAWLGEVVLPPRFTVFEITGDRILGVRLDDLDVPHPQVLGLHRGGDGGGGAGDA